MFFIVGWNPICRNCILIQNFRTLLICFLSNCEQSSGHQMIDWHHQGLFFSLCDNTEEKLVAYSVDLIFLFLWWSGDVFMCSDVGPWHYSSRFTGQRATQTLAWQNTNTLQAESFSLLLRYCLTGIDNWHLPMSATMLRSWLDVKIDRTSNISPLTSIHLSVSPFCCSLNLLPSLDLDDPQ